MSDKVTDTRIAAALEEAARRGEKALQVAAYLGDKLIVHDWIGLEGTRDPANSLFATFSIAKAVTWTTLHLCRERGWVDINAPVVDVWPEFAPHGKAAIKISDVLTHRTGFPQMPATTTKDNIGDWDWVVNELAGMEPLAPPGEKSYYSSLNSGFIIGEIVRRVDPQHRFLNDFLYQELNAPLGVRDSWLGLPDSEAPRMIDLVAEKNTASRVPGGWLREAVVPPEVAISPESFNDPRMRRACIPAAGGIATAKDTARFFSLLANGGAAGSRQLISETYLRTLLRPRNNPMQHDECIGGPTWIGIGGYWLGGPNPPSNPLHGGRTSILGHGGAGGTCAWADMDSGLSVAILHNRMFGPVSQEEHPLLPIAEAIWDVARGR